MSNLFETLANFLTTHSTIINYLDSLLTSNFKILIQILIFSLVLYPTSTLIHERGHIRAIKKVNKDYNLILENKAYLYLYPKFTSGGTISIIKDTNTSFIDYLEERKEYKKLIHIFSSGLKAQILSTLFFTSIIFLLFCPDYIFATISTLTFTTPQILFIFTNYFFAKGNQGNLSDRQQIKRLKKLIKKEKE